MGIIIVNTLVAIQKSPKYGVRGIYSRYRVFNGATWDTSTVKVL